MKGAIPRSRVPSDSEGGGGGCEHVPRCLSRPRPRAHLLSLGSSASPSLSEGGDCLGSEGFWDGLSGDAVRVVGGTVLKHSRGFADNAESEDLGTVEEFSAG